MALFPSAGGGIGSFDEDAADVNQDTLISISDVTALIDMLLSGEGALLTTSHWDAVPTAGGISIENPMGEYLEVFDLDANVVAVSTEVGSATIELPSGIYLVTSDSTSRKLVVK